MEMEEEEEEEEMKKMQVTMTEKKEEIHNEELCDVTMPSPLVFLSDLW